jgi:tetratricopeptide (TPR) repeat protein
MLVFTAEQFGMPKIVQALKLWGEGARTPDVITRAFGVSPSDYDAKYRAWELAKLARYKGQFLFTDRAKPLDEAKAKVAAAPNDASAHVGLALSLLHARKGHEAEQEIEAALKLDATNMTAHYVAAKLAKGDPNAQGTHLAAIQRAGGDGFVVQMGLADVAEMKKDKAAMRAALEAAARFDPSQSEPLKGLFDLANDDKREADALEVLKKLAVLEQHDRRVWRMLLDRLVAQKKWDDVKRFGEAAIFVDVESAMTHVNYARGLAATGAHDKAVFELESALACNAPPKELAAAHALFAQELALLRNPAAAKGHLAEALRLDPENPDAKALRIP